MASKYRYEGAGNWNCIRCGKVRVDSTVKLFVPSTAKLPVGVSRGPYCGECFEEVWPW